MKRRCSSAGKASVPALPLPKLPAAFSRDSDHRPAAAPPSPMLGLSTGVADAACCLNAATMSEIDWSSPEAALTEG
eukprot:13914350-Alexandrium_andersonii.AAC.1